MNRVVEILMQRDGITQEEATELVEQTKEEILEVLDMPVLDADEIIASNLGLEPDYIFDILDI